MAEVVEMHPDLVSPAAVENAFNQADVGAGTQDAVFGFRGAALTSGDAHPLPVNGVARDGFVDHPRFLPQDPALV